MHVEQFITLTTRSIFSCLPVWQTILTEGKGFSFIETVAEEIFMGQPKRKQSKTRSRLRRGAHKTALPLLAREADGTLVRWHHVNPETGVYRDRQVLDVKL